MASERSRVSFSFHARATCGTKERVVRVPANITNENDRIHGISLCVCIPATILNRQEFTGRFLLTASGLRRFRRELVRSNEPPASFLHQEEHVPALHGLLLCLMANVIEKKYVTTAHFPPA